MSCLLHSKKMDSPEINQAQLPESLTPDENAACPSSLLPRERMPDVAMVAASPPLTKCGARIEIVNTNWG